LLIIVVNVGIVFYMLMLRLEAAKKRHAQHSSESG
jgi:preprotein translocase subunit YajC